MQKLLETLHPLERKVLPVLRNYNNLKDIIKETNLKEVEVMRALQWLENKKIITLKKEVKEIISLDINGEKYLREGLPEKRFLQAINKESSLDDIKIKVNLSKDEVNSCIGLLRSRNLISIHQNLIKITSLGEKYLKETQPEELFLRALPRNIIELSKEEKIIYNLLKKRKKIIKTSLEKTRIATLTKLGKDLIKAEIKDDFIDSLNIEILINKSWKGKKFRRYDVKINVPKIYPGKRHFVNQAVEYARRIWLDLGFKEMQGPLIHTSFWNFDALFTAQDHPVRELQDTFFIKNPEKGKLPNKDIVNKVKKTHEDGWTTNSLGWQYKWQEEEAKKNVLRTHTTPLSAQTLAKLRKEELPAKFFSVGKCFRNETLDWSHLFEFNQTEGIVIDEDANFKHLIGYLKEFFKKMGFPQIRVRPFYFPYTEVSLELDAFHPIHKKWVELGGAGIFRPEVVKPLMGKDIPVLAWGIGYDRMIMDYYKINDIRELYKNDLKQLRNIKEWLK